ncbi:hypothetical protein ACQP2E_12120 [Actinoplanes sp. CA-015351]|uniref:hypothetical protein n=1 Tax=Actinoplanes sp. CA-015351 TaxID=3239897 RepID=UPI003D963090
MDKQALQLVGDELDYLAQTPGTNEAALSLLATELHQGGARLAGVDLLAAYPPDLLIDHDAAGRRPRALTIIATVRDLLVFAPIAVTWWSLHQVLDAWSGQNYPGNLLQFWQTRQEGLSLSEAALWVVAILVLVAALTLIIVVADSGERRVALLKERLTTQLTAASLLLAGPSQESRTTARQLASTAGHLGDSTSHLVEAINRVGGDLHSVATAGPGSDLHDALMEWRNSAAALSRLGESMTAPAEMMREFVALRTAVEAEEAALRRAIQTVAERLEESTTVAVREGLAHTRVAEDAREATQGLSTALDRFTERTQDLGTLVAQVRQLLIRLEASGLLVPEQRIPRDNAYDGFPR